MVTKDKVRFLEETLRQADAYLFHGNMESAKYQAYYLRGLLAAWNADATIPHTVYNHYWEEMRARNI